MKISTLTLAVSLAAATAGCSQALGDSGSSGPSGSGESTGTDGSGVGGGRGEGNHIGHGADSDGSGGALDGPPPTAGSGAGDAGGGSSDGGGSAGGGINDCATCCVGEVSMGTDPFYIRVDDSSSFASPLLTRALIAQWDGQRPLPVRLNEYLNFYPPRALGPSLAQDFTSSDGAVQIAPTALNKVFALQVAIRSAPTSTSSGRTIALVVDTSRSAGSAVDELLGSVDAVFEQLGDRDVIGVYSWASDPAARVIRPFGTVPDVASALQAVRERVVAELAVRDPAASLTGPLAEALREAQERAKTAGGDGTVVLVSDGSAGVEDASLQAVKTAAEAPRGKVRVIGVGVGDPRFYSDDVLDRITDASGGAYLYFDGSDEAKALLGSRFRELSEVVARDVRLRVELPPSVTLVKSDGGTDEAIGSETEVDGQNIGWGGTMTFHQALEWSGDPGSECDAVVWKVMRGRGSAEVSLAQGTMVVGDVFAGLRATPSVLESTAVVAAADALRGPTDTRMASATAALRAAAAMVDPEVWETSPLHGLCETVLRACDAKGFECGNCEPDPLPDSGEGT